MPQDLVTLMERVGRGLGWINYYRSDLSRIDGHTRPCPVRKESLRIAEPDISKAEKQNIARRMKQRKLEKTEEYQLAKEARCRELQERRHREEMCKNALANFVAEHGMPPPDYYETIVAKARKYFGLT